MNNINITQLDNLKDEQKDVHNNHCDNTGCSGCRLKGDGLNCRYNELQGQINELEWSEL